MFGLYFVVRPESRNLKPCYETLLHQRMKCSVVFQFDMYYVSKTSEESSQEKSETLKKHLHVHTREQWWAIHVVDCSFLPVIK